MASAEEKTAWHRQRSANHFFVQENARRGPKFSGSPSSSSSSRSVSDNTPDNDMKGPNEKCAGLLPFYHSYDVLSDRKWWLNQQPNSGQYRDIMSEQLSSLEAEALDGLSYEFISKTANICEDGKEFSAKTGCSFEEPLWDVITTSMRDDHDMVMQGHKVDTRNDPQKNSTKKDVTDFWYSDGNFMNMDSLNCLDSQPSKMSSDIGSQWVATEKTEPWWKTAGKDDLASLVAQKSLEHIENCDLPRPQGKNYGNGKSASPESVDHDEILTPSLGRMAHARFSNNEFSTRGSPLSGSSAHDLDHPFSSNGYSTDETGTQNISDDEQTKAQLMEALCHSQTRARQAENAAKKAYSEKEHIITLFFRQASQLFAYKQWLRLLQLENLCLQLKKKNELIPSVLPWVPYKGRQMKKGQHRAGKRKHGKPVHELRKSVVAFAVGLGLASAGLLLGWTMGWLFPCR